MFEINNYKGLLIRQLTTGIYTEPREAYLTKLKEKEAIEAEYARITSSKVSRPQ